MSYPPRDGDLLGPDTLEQAAEWFAILRNEQADEQDHRRWREWLEADERHRQAWALAESIDQQLRSLPGQPAGTALREGTNPHRRRVLKGLAGLAVIAPAAWIGWEFTPLRTMHADFRTAVGEIREIALADGTRVWLNTASALTVDFDTRRRHLKLLSGEILVETAPDARPLVVRTGSGWVSPLGTRFSVRDEGNATRVTVETGRVDLTPARSTSTVTLKAGESTTFNSNSVDPVRAAQAGQTAWQRGTLLADNMRLDVFLNELSRYRHGVIQCHDHVSAIRLVGAYPLADTDRVLDALEQTLPIRVVHLTRWWVRVSPV